VDGFLLFGHINNATTAFTDLLEQFVAANAVAGFIGGEAGGSNWRNGCRIFEEGTGFIAGLKQFHNTLTQGRVTGAGFIEISGALPHRQPPGSAKDSQFAIRLICHVQTALLSAHQCGNPAQKAQKNIGHPKTIEAT
jgi:hypothetical protein